MTLIHRTELKPKSIVQTLTELLHTPHLEKPRIEERSSTEMNHEHIQYLQWFLLTQVRSRETPSFCMLETTKETECGTLRCVGGWMFHLWKALHLHYYDSCSPLGMVWLNFLHQKYDDQYDLATWKPDFTYLFDSKWTFFDNSIEGAVIRLEQYRREQLPKRRMTCEVNYTKELIKLKEATAAKFN